MRVTPPVAASVDSLRTSIIAINPGAGVSLIVNGEVDPGALTNLGLASARAGPATLRFLGESLAQTDSAGERYLGARSARHDPSIKTLSLRFDKPFTWPSFSAALELLATLRGPDQHIFHPPVSLDRWPSADTGTRLVFITHHIEGDIIRNLLQAVGEVAEPAPAKRLAV